MPGHSIAVVRALKSGLWPTPGGKERGPGIRPNTVYSGRPRDAVRPQPQRRRGRRGPTGCELGLPPLVSRSLAASARRLAAAEESGGEFGPGAAWPSRGRPRPVSLLQSTRFSLILPTVVRVLSRRLEYFPQTRAKAALSTLGVPSLRRPAGSAWDSCARGGGAARLVPSDVRLPWSSLLTLQGIALLSF